MMLLLTLQLAAWFAVTCASYLPCAVHGSTAEYMNQLKNHNGSKTGIDPGAFGGATEIGLDENEPGRFLWPRSKSTGLANIPYCYETEEDRNAFKGKIDEAIQAWYDALGGPPSEESGHGISFNERVDGCGSPLFCDDGIGEWNFDIKYKTIAISQREDGPPHATVGHRRSYPDRQAWDMTLQFASWLPTFGIIHELGHVIGLIHEHQRSDRDDHVIYRCHNVIGLAEALQRAQADDPSITEEQLCTDNGKALQYGFSGTEFMKYPVAGTKDFTAGTDYDVLSIMHYPSFAFARPGSQRENLNDAVLLKRKTPNGDEGEEINPAVEISAGDVSIVKMLYPWQAPSVPVDDPSKK